MQKVKSSNRHNVYVIVDFFKVTIDVKFNQSARKYRETWSRLKDLNVNKNNSTLIRAEFLCICESKRKWFCILDVAGRESFCREADATCT